MCHRNRDDVLLATHVRKLTTQKQCVQMQALHTIIDDNLIHVERTVQETAGQCLQHFLAGYGTPEYAAHVTRYCEGLFDSDSDAVRSGSGIALAAVPCCMLQPVRREALQQVCRACNVDSVAQKRDAEARVYAITVRPR